MRIVLAATVALAVISLALVSRPSTRAGLDPPVITTIPDGFGPWALAVDEERNLIFVSDKISHFAVMDGAANELISQTRTDQIGVTGIAVDGSRGRAYISIGSEVLVISADTLEEIDRFEPGSYDPRIDIGDETGLVYLGGNEGFEVRNLAGNRVNASATLNIEALAVDDVRDKLYLIAAITPASWRLLSVDLDTPDFAPRFPIVYLLEEPAYDLVFNEDSGRLYVTRDRVISVLDAGSGVTLGESETLDSQSLAMAVDRSTGCVYSILHHGNSLEGQQVVILSADAEVLETWEFPSASLHAVAVNSTTGRVYLANATVDGGVIVLETYGQPELCAPATKSPVTPSPQPTPAELPNTGGHAKP